MSVGTFLRQAQADDWITPYLESKLEQHPEGRDRWIPPTTHIRPSWSGDPCPRSIQIGLLGYRDGMGVRGFRRTRNGRDAEKRWQEEFREAGILVDANVKLKHEDWSGECDIIVQRPGTTRQQIIEVKTMHSRRWMVIPKQVAPREMARQILVHERGYLFQMVQYLVEFGKHRGTDPVGALLFENTDTQEPKLRLIEPDEGLIRDAYAVPREAQAATREGRLIPPPFKRTSMACKTCYRRRPCFALQDEEPEITSRAQEALSAVTTVIPELELEEFDLDDWR